MSTPDLFSTAHLPEQEQFPMNQQGVQTLRFIRADIKDSADYVVITGYSSLSFIVEQLGRDLDARGCVSIVLGNEPVLHQLRVQDAPFGQGSVSLPEQIRRFWLSQGISILLNGPVLNLIEKIRFGKVQFLIHPNLHAKIYKGDQHVMLGSSNFSRPGLQSQGEANVRHSWGADGFDEIGQMADYYLNEAQPWNEDMIALLEQLLRNVSWQEALGRAVALITEGSWISDFPERWQQRQQTKLWPTQRQAIAQALYLLERQGSVLVADPTGSGKTRMGAHLLEALLNRLWFRSRQRGLQYQIICPPLVTDTWVRELSTLESTIADPISHGMLSSSDAQSREATLEKIRRAHILVVDEAHNYLNKTSARSQSVVMNRADHMMLFTATPLNRRSDDLLRLVEILGLDNLSEEAWKTYSELQKSRDQRSQQALAKLRTYVHRFMVRRTKAELNEAITRDPDSYRDAYGALCRYPQSISKTYKTGETEADIALAAEIESLMSGLKGIPFLANLTAEAFDLETTERQEQFLQKRLRAAPALMQWNLRNMLRSSRAALIEHLLGTKAALLEFGLKEFKNQNTGNIIQKIRDMSIEPPRYNLRIVVPAWIQDPLRWQQACAEEAGLLERIAERCLQISDSREATKAKQLGTLIDRHGMILAFDSALITLQIIRKKLKALGYGRKSMIVTGSTGNTKKILKKNFALDAKDIQMAALCSDALSEGVNLQRASAVLFLDMPSVIRIAEQRIGRVDRMDSPHREVTVYWPDDAPVFRLRTDRSFFFRHHLVQELIGSNISPPEKLLDEYSRESEETLDADTLISSFEEQQRTESSWEGFEDAFTVIRRLVSGERPLIPADVFEEVRRTPVTDGPWLSVVETDRPFIFMAVRGSQQTAPYWLLRRHKRGNPAEANGTESERAPAVLGDAEQDLSQIAPFLRKVLPGSSPAEFYTNSEAEQLLAGNIAWLDSHERETLPNKKRNALDQLESLVSKWDRRLRKGMIKVKENKEANFGSGAENSDSELAAKDGSFSGDVLPGRTEAPESDRTKAKTKPTKKQITLVDADFEKAVRKLHRLFQQKSRSNAGGAAAAAYGSSGTGDESGFAGTAAEQPDWYELANRWLDLAQPMLIAWLEREKRRRKYREIRLTNLTPHLTLHPPSGEQLLTLLENLPRIEPARNRIVAAIIGVGRSAKSQNENADEKSE
ncbi:MAG: hypothetical protein JJU35_14825 [Balneolales bacterium]|nr:hypothetical protein [Balneolales bacterium]